MAEDLGRLLAGRYRLSGPLGRGGMGTVWRAYDQRLDREVALKELRLPEGLDPDQQASWIARTGREARAAARLKHPGIITVHDQFTGEDGRPWIVMELVHGRSLADVLAQEGPLPPDRVAAIGRQVADALRAAHQAGITHRDVKPANVMLEGDRALLTDFGIAAIEGDAKLTRSGAILGTPAYMAPEQVRGQAATPESDLWSLGATLFAAVEGRPPFDGAGPGAVFVAIATQDPAPAVRAGPLAPVIGGLLRKDPAQRLTAESVSNLLTRPPMPPPAYSPARPAASPRRRTPALVAAAVAAVLLVATGAAYAFWAHDSGYERDRRAVRDLGAPAGYTATSEQDLGSGRVRRTFTGCAAPCPASRLGERFDAVRAWLTSRPGVLAVAAVQPQTCFTGTGCTLQVRASRRPAISAARVSMTPRGEVLLAVDFG